MIALDTNVLVRLLTRDDEAQARRAKAAFDAQAGEHGGLFIADVVLAELCWTLARAYRLAGKTEDARKTLTQVVEQHADSPFATEAKAEIAKLKS